MLLSGGAIGREGPTLQVAGSIFQTVYRFIPPGWSRVSQRIMLITGGASGLAAAFNTPLGGIVYALEELTKTHIARFRTAVFSAVIIAGMTAQSFLGTAAILVLEMTDRHSAIFYFLLAGMIANLGAGMVLRRSFYEIQKDGYLEAVGGKV